MINYYNFIITLMCLSLIHIALLLASFRFLRLLCSGSSAACHALHVYDSKVLRTPRVFIITNYKEEEKKSCCSGGVNKHKKVFRVPLPRSKSRSDSKTSLRLRESSLALGVATPLDIVANLSGDVVAFNSTFFVSLLFFYFSPVTLLERHLHKSGASQRVSERVSI
jgi:hypothetical protein